MSDCWCDLMRIATDLVRPRVPQVESCFRAKEVELVMQFRKICRHVAAVEHYPVSDSPSSREFSSFEQLQSLLEGNC
jgi:hypothetical protein